MLPGGEDNAMRVIARLPGFLLFAALALAAAEPLSAADWQAGAPPEWQKLMAAAKQEGRVVVAGRSGMARGLSEGFKRDTGLDIDFLEGESRDLLARLTREMRAGAVSLDLLLGAQTTIEFVKQGYMKPIAPQLVLPGVLDPAHWTDGRLKWMDKEASFLLEPSEFLFGQPIFNSDLVKPGEIAAWRDLLTPHYKGKIAAFDPRAVGAGQAAAAYLAEMFGVGFVKQLYAGQDVTFTGNARQLVEWVARGTYAVGLGATPPEIEEYRTKLGNIAVGEMSDGPGSLLGGSSVVAEPKGAPHPNAAAIFLNWYASQPAQQIYAETWQAPSRRLDVQVATIPDYVRPKPGVRYLDQYQEDWYVNVRPKVQSAIVEALGGR
jgi:ABC-type Fe3+ transport system substrate-binding protein